MRRRLRLRRAGENTTNCYVVLRRWNTTSAGHTFLIWQVVQLYNCNGGDNQKFSFKNGALSTAHSHRCVASRATSPGGGTTVQIWAKPQPDGAVAVFVLNAAAHDDIKVKIQFADVGLAPDATVNVRDVWARADVGQAKGEYSPPPIGAHDSALLMLSPSDSPGTRAVS